LEIVYHRHHPKPKIITELTGFATGNSITQRPIDKAVKAWTLLIFTVVAMLRCFTT